ncbi:hypothetical protein OQA88_8526 [Cercophora sp. LCS_1]
MHLFLLTLPTLAAATALTPRQKPSGACSAVHLFLARGAGDPYPGTQGPLVPAVCDTLPSCDHEDILYVGTFDRVCNSVQIGVANATSQITAYAARCPESKLVLCGHSEGAAVIGNTIGGGSTSFPGCQMPATTGLDPDSSPGNTIRAVALTGDMRHAASQSYNVGTGAARSGIWVRSATELQGLNKWATKIRSWCDSGDPVCAGGSNVQAHGAYMNIKAEIAAWIHSML